MPAAASDRPVLPDRPTPTRRAVLASAAWATPVIAMTAAAPLASASAPAVSAAGSCRSTVSYAAAPSDSLRAFSDPLMLTALSATGARSTVRVLSSTTVDTETRGRSGSPDGRTAGFNMLTQDGATAAAWAGLSFSDRGSEVILHGFAPMGTLMLNQRGYGIISNRDAVLTYTTASGAVFPVNGSGIDVQTLTFEFLDAQGVPFDPVDLQLTIHDITSHDDSAWVARFWDTVGFSTAPTSITATGPNSQGVGAGTTADPYRRASGEDDTPNGLLTTDGSAGTFADRFTFASFPSGSTLTYSQHDRRRGWHAIALGELSFRSAVC